MRTWQHSTRYTQPLSSLSRVTPQDLGFFPACDELSGVWRHLGMQVDQQSLAGPLHCNTLDSLDQNVSVRLKHVAIAH